MSELFFPIFDFNGNKVFPGGEAFGLFVSKSRREVEDAAALATIMVKGLELVEVKSFSEMAQKDGGAWKFHIPSPIFPDWMTFDGAAFEFHEFAHEHGIQPENLPDDLKGTYAPALKVGNVTFVLYPVFHSEQDARKAAEMIIAANKGIFEDDGIQPIGFCVPENDMQGVEVDEVFFTTHGMTSVFMVVEEE